jgi:hypothetical protein
MTLRNGMTTEGFDYLYKLKSLNEIIIENKNNTVFIDFNLSPEVIEKFVNIKEFQLIGYIIPVDGVKGIIYIQKLS